MQYFAKFKAKFDDIYERLSSLLSSVSNSPKFPDYDSKTAIDALPYAAPQDGWIYVRFRGMVDSYAKIGGIEVARGGDGLRLR